MHCCFLALPSIYFRPRNMTLPLIIYIYISLFIVPTEDKKNMKFITYVFTVKFTYF